MAARMMSAVDQYGETQAPDRAPNSRPAERIPQRLAGHRTRAERMYQDVAPVRQRAAAGGARYRDRRLSGDAPAGQRWTLCAGPTRYSRECL
jgi:hypothetical protein